MADSSYYYVPEKSHWPLIGSVALLFLALGAVQMFHDNFSWGVPLLSIGALIMAVVLFGWFGSVIFESETGLHNDLMDRSYRWGMIWFIFSEVMFFAAFFGALFYMRNYSVPWLAGAGSKSATHTLLWPEFKAAWPLMVNPDPELFVGPRHILSPWGIPLINTLLLLSSAVTLTWAHWAMKVNRRGMVITGLALTVLLGFIFLGCQTYEYILAHTVDGLTMSSGAFGTTFFFLTGFHGAHVTLGAIMLTVILIRCIKGHFTPEHHFGFEAVAWYWHFVDYVWLTLFVFVYWI